jgi:hypothetical protein
MLEWTKETSAAARSGADDVGGIAGGGTSHEPSARRA